MTPAEQPAPPAPCDSLGSGAAGIALLHIQRAQAGTGSWNTAHQWITAATRGPAAAHPGIAGLYRGAPAVAFALHTADRSGHTTALDTLDGHIATLTQHRLHEAHQRIDRMELPCSREFDLISGLTGIGVYLLHRDRDTDQLRNVLTYLARLTEPIHAGGATLPGWWCGNAPTDQPAHRWPGGHGNLGIAHGIAGPLALLAIAKRRGITVPGQAEAIDRICHWLDTWRCDNGSRVWWPGRITRSELQSATVQQRGPQRPSWCYGTPGLARAQQLAALALDDPIRQRQAENTLAGCATDDHQLDQLTDASLCHGWAGLVLTVCRSAADASDCSRLPDIVPRLVVRLAQQLNRHGSPASDGLLDGASGVRLVQLTTATNKPSTARWDTCLLLTG